MHINLQRRPTTKPLARVLFFLRPLQLLALIFVCFGFMILNYFENPLIKNLRVSFYDFSGKAIYILSRPLNFFDEVKSDISSYFGIHRAYEKALEENRALLHWRNRAQNLAIENQKLRAQLKMLPKTSHPYLTVAVLGNFHAHYLQTFIIDGGRAQGIQEKQTVLYDNQIIGQILEVGEHTATVLLITDLNSRVPVESSASNTQGIVAGAEGASLRLIHTHDHKNFSPGDVLYTTGTGGLFPKDLKVGTVTRLEEDEIIVSSGLDWGHVEYVHVLTKSPLSSKERRLRK